MSEPWPVYDIFSPILIGNYIRFETAAKCIANREAGNKDVPELRLNLKSPRSITSSCPAANIRRR